MFTDQGRKQLQVLFADVHVETTIVQIHLRAATRGRREHDEQGVFSCVMFRCTVRQVLWDKSIPADDPVQGFGADMQGSSDIPVVQVEGGGSGVSAGRVQTDRQVER